MDPRSWSKKKRRERNVTLKILWYFSKCYCFDLDTTYYSSKLLYGQISRRRIKMIPAFVPVLRCSLMRTLISSSWWRSEVSRSGRRSPTLGCSLAIVAPLLEGWSEELSEVGGGGRSRPFSPAWSTPGATHQYCLQAPLHHTRVNLHTHFSELGLI